MIKSEENNKIIIIYREGHEELEEKLKISGAFFKAFTDSGLNQLSTPLVLDNNTADLIAPIC